jgi:hypothetical protein
MIGDGTDAGFLVFAGAGVVTLATVVLSDAAVVELSVRR